MELNIFLLGMHMGDGKKLYSKYIFCERKKQWENLKRALLLPIIIQVEQKQSRQGLLVVLLFVLN